MRENGAYVQYCGFAAQTPRCSQPCQAFASQFSGGKEVDFHHLAQSLLIRLIEPSNGSCTCVVNEDIKRLPMFGDPLGDGLSMCGMGEVPGYCLQRARAVLALLLQRLQSIVASSCGQHMRTSVNQLFAESTTDPAGSPRHQNLGTL